MMHAHEKSDSVMVARKPTNKAERSATEQTPTKRTLRAAPVGAGVGSATARNAEISFRGTIKVRAMRASSEQKNSTLTC
jgi:hypothetical protein